MGLFGKKYCVICGKEIGLLGGKKLADGDICKGCLGMVSPWLSDRREMTAADMSAHLAYRNENYSWLQNFRQTAVAVCSSGDSVAWDANNRWFYVARTRNVMQENPDILTPEHILGVTLRLEENINTRRHDEPDRPPFEEVRYSYYFRYFLNVNHNWFQEIHFNVNTFSLDAWETPKLQQAYREAWAVKQLFESMGVTVNVEDMSTFGMNYVVSGQLPPQVLDPMMAGAAMGAAVPPPPPPAPPRPAPRPAPGPGPRPGPGGPMGGPGGPAGGPGNRPMGGPNGGRPAPGGPAGGPGNRPMGGPNGGRPAPGGPAGRPGGAMGGPNSGARPAGGPAGRPGGAMGGPNSGARPAGGQSPARPSAPSGGSAGNRGPGGHGSHGGPAGGPGRR